MQLRLGDCLDVLKTLPDNSVDSIVCDPPYGLRFMSSKWDYDVPSKEIWIECLRVLKHGGHLLAFGGTRTYHRLVVEIEDAGFEIRDCIQWLYGTGFPKSHNISKAIDKAAGAEREVIGKQIHPTLKDTTRNDRQSKTQFHGKNTIGDSWDITAPTTSEAKQWDGWGTALKPAHEPIVLARKPIIRTVADNVLEHGTGGLNIDGCRIEAGADHAKNTNRKSVKSHWGASEGFAESIAHEKGRFPANVILTHHPECIQEGNKRVKSNSHWSKVKVSGFNKNLGGDNEYEGIGEKKKSEVVENWKCHPECPIKILDEQSGISQSSDAVRKNKREDEKLTMGGKIHAKEGSETHGFKDKGGASRFFYCAKSSKREKNYGLEKNNHPTVKPVKLMRYLCRLITPPNGTVLDPFMGSGTTGIGAMLEGFDFIGIEMEEEYLKIAEARIEAWKIPSHETTIKPSKTTKISKSKNLSDW